MPRIDKIINKYKDNKVDINNAVKKMSSNSGTKDFKKREWENIIPNMTCDENLVRDFRKEAQEKQWSYTTLMNNILKHKYTTIKPKLLLVMTQDYHKNKEESILISIIDLNNLNALQRKKILISFNNLNIHWDYVNPYEINYDTENFFLWIQSIDKQKAEKEINKIKNCSLKENESE